MGSGEGGGGGAVAVGDDQFGDLALTEVLVQAPWTLALGFGVHTGLVSAAG
ncbi:MAG: hypothetical protein ACRDRG_12140 [Pseudonocardiaceae bacterium]